jgi:hypothetical protein
LKFSQSGQELISSPGHPWRSEIIGAARRLVQPAKKRFTRHQFAVVAMDQAKINGIYILHRTILLQPALFRSEQTDPGDHHLRNFVAVNARTVALQQNTVRFAALPFAHLVYDFSMFLNSHKGHA